MKFQRGVIQKGIWWRSDVRLEGETIVPVPPFHSYNVFDFYFPLERSTETQKTPSLCYEILNVDGRDSQAVLRFCERFGVPGRPDFGSRIYTIQDVLTKAKDPFDRLAGYETAGKLAPKDTLLHFLQLHSGIYGAPPEQYRCTPITLARFREVQAGLRVLLHKIKSKEEKNLALTSLTPKLMLARYRLDWDPQTEQWVDSWDLGSLEAALYLMLVWDLRGPGMILSCLRCSRTFLATHSRTKYCSLICQNTDKAKRHRERLREAERTKKSRKSSMAFSEKKPLKTTKNKSRKG